VTCAAGNALAQLLPWSYWTFMISWYVTRRCWPIVLVPCVKLPAGLGFRSY